MLNGNSMEKIRMCLAVCTLLEGCSYLNVFRLPLSFTLAV